MKTVVKARQTYQALGNARKVAEKTALSLRRIKKYKLILPDINENGPIVQQIAILRIRSKMGGVHFLL